MSGPKSESANKLYFIICVILSVLFSLLHIHEGHNWGDDFAMYITQSYSLMNGTLNELYIQNKFMVDHSSCLAGPYLYPNGFPVLILPILYFAGTNFILLKMYCTLFFIATIPLIYLLFKDKFQNKINLNFFILCIALNPIYFTFSDEVRSDFPFLFFAMLSMYLMMKAKTVYHGIVLGVVIFCSYMIRDVGIILVLALMGLQIYTYRKTRELNIINILVPYFVFFLLSFSIRSITPKGDENLFNYLLESNASSILSNSMYYAKLFGCYFTGIDYRSKSILIILLTMLMSISVFIFTFIGIRRNAKDNVHFIIYSVATLFILLIWPYKQGYRFIFTLLPFFIFFTLKGVEFIFERNKFNFKYVIYIYLCYLFILDIKLTLESQSISTDEVGTKEMSSVYNYINKFVPEQEIIAFRRSRALRLFTNRTTICGDYESFPNAVANYLFIDKRELNGEMRYEIDFETENYLLFKKANN